MVTRDGADGRAFGVRGRAPRSPTAENSARTSRCAAGSRTPPLETQIRPIAREAGPLRTGPRVCTSRAHTCVRSARAQLRPIASRIQAWPSLFRTRTQGVHLARAHPGAVSQGVQLLRPTARESGRALRHFAPDPGCAPHARTPWVQSPRVCSSARLLANPGLAFAIRTGPRVRSSRAHTLGAVSPGAARARTPWVRSPQVRSPRVGAGLPHTLGAGGSSVECAGGAAGFRAKPVRRFG